MGVNLRKVRQGFTVKRLSAAGFAHRTRTAGFSVCQQDMSGSPCGKCIVCKSSNVL